MGSFDMFLQEVEKRSILRVLLTILGLVVIGIIWMQVIP